MRCVICESDIINSFENYKNYWKCSNCGTVFQQPFDIIDYRDYSKTRSIGREKRIQQYKLDLIELNQFVGGGRVLDVGCGDGTFLKLFPSSFLRDGIDLRGSYRIGDYTTYNFNKEEQFDLIMMRATLEHISTPHEFIQKSHDILAEDGVLAITHLPNIDNYPKCKSLVKPREHIILYSVKSIQLLLLKHDFDILDIRFSYFGTPYQYDEGASFMNVMNVYARKRCY